LEVSESGIIDRSRAGEMRGSHCDWPGRGESAGRVSPQREKTCLRGCVLVLLCAPPSS